MGAGAVTAGAAANAAGRGDLTVRGERAEAEGAGDGDRKSGALEDVRSHGVLLAG
jgi:hypothetical protein